MPEAEINILYALIAGILFVVAGFAFIFFLLKKIGKDPRNILPVGFAKRIRVPLVVFLISLFLQLAVLSKVFRFDTSYEIARHLSILGFILSITWIIISLLRVFKNRMLKRYDVSTQDNLKARKVYTQFMILENIIIFIIILLAVGIALMSFDSIRSIGLSLLTSAGIAGIIIGLAAQKAIGTLLAGIQIAITQPIRLDDVVIVDGEWGRIEEITLTYVVVKIWDQRRLVVPSTFFIENTFQNWTRNSSEIMGTVFIYTDYRVPFEALREELGKLLKASKHWDGKVNVLQVTDTTEKTVQIRALMSARDSGTAWELRVYVREKLLEFLQKNYPESLPRTRISIENEDSSGKDQ
ncbi:mechanosensitive ion channel family protein [Salegentibacter sp. HM20]